MTCRVVLVQEAERQLKDIDDWWLRNRRGAPDLFLDELSKAIDLLAELPDIGPRFIRSKRPGIRRLLLRRSHYWIYYFHDRKRSLVYILALWSTSRGRDPELPKPTLG